MSIQVLIDDNADALGVCAAEGASAAKRPHGVDVSLTGLGNDGAATRAQHNACRMELGMPTEAVWREGVGQVLSLDKIGKVLQR